MADTVTSRRAGAALGGRGPRLGPSSGPGRSSVEALATATGWDLRPEGLCNGDACVPVRDRATAVPVDGQVDLTVVAPLLDRPVVVDADAGIVAVGAPAPARRQALVDRRPRPSPFPASTAPTTPWRSSRAGPRSSSRSRPGAAASTTCRAGRPSATSWPTTACRSWPWPSTWAGSYRMGMVRPSTNGRTTSASWSITSGGSAASPSSTSRRNGSQG